MWVHMGGMGPRSPKLLPTGGMPPPPYQLKDNPDTWLDKTDLVFIDPVGTGYSRAKTVEIARRMNGVQGDIQSVGEFMRHVHRRATAAKCRRCSSPARVTARSARRDWQAT